MRLRVDYDGGGWDEGEIDDQGDDALHVAAKLAATQPELIPFKDGRVLMPIYGSVRSMILSPEVSS